MSILAHTNIPTHAQAHALKHTYTHTHTHTHTHNGFDKSRFFSKKKFAVP